MIVNCPLPAALSSIPAVTCPFRFDQLVKLAFQRRQAAAPFATLADAQDIAKWTAFEAAVGNTKIVTSPIFVSPTLPRSEALTAGGNDNSTFAGIRDYNGEGSITFGAQLKNLPPAIKRAMDLLSQESLASAVGISNLTAYFINKDGYIFCVNPVDGAGAATTTYFGIPIYNFRISSPGTEGLNSANINDISFDLPANWADYLVSIKPGFDPLTAI